jgi:hypothetical protein
MPANTSPIFTIAPDFSAVRIAAATLANTVNAPSDGSGTIGTNMFLAFSPGANGSYLQKIRFSLVESTIGTASAPCVLRVFLSTQSTGSTTNANTWLIQEVFAATQTPSSTSPASPIDIPLNFAIPSTFFVLVSTSVAPNTNTNWNANVFAGDY